MTAWVGHAQLIIRIQLFSGIHFHHHRLAMFGGDASAVVIQHEFRVDQFAMIFQQPVHTIGLATFLVRGER